MARTVLGAKRVSGRRVLKFVVDPYGSMIETEDEPRFLAVGWQGEKLVVWCEAVVGEGVHTPVVTVRTGDPAPPAEAVYVGTASTVVFGSELVIHVYHGPRQ
jgi:hypothetical protein